MNLNLEDMGTHDALSCPVCHEQSLHPVNTAVGAGSVAITFKCDHGKHWPVLLLLDDADNGTGMAWQRMCSMEAVPQTTYRRNLAEDKADEQGDADTREQGAAAARP